MIAISCALDSSLAEAKLRGTLQAHRERYKLFSSFDNVVLLTQDSEGFSKFDSIRLCMCLAPPKT